MYFLNGDRLYIKPEKANISLNEQLQNCLNQLKRINSGKEIFKLNFFVDAVSDLEYNRLNSEIRLQISNLFSQPVITSLIAQPPLSCKIIIEVFLYDPKSWQAKPVRTEGDLAILFRRGNSEILIGTAQTNTKFNFIGNAKDIFATLGELLEKVNFPIKSIVRQWNYIEDIVGFDEKRQKYQDFNDVRSAFYAKHFEKTGYPAATGIGMNRGGIIVEFVAVKSSEAKTLPVDNPAQISAHHYSEKVLIGETCNLKSTPKFERARYFELFDKKLIFISGTASIIGENTIGVGDPVKQTEITIQNIQKLYSEEVVKKVTDKPLIPKYGHARVYVKDRKDFKAIRKTFRSQFGNLPVVYIIADICRDDLLVEIEGKVILE